MSGSKLSFLFLVLPVFAAGFFLFLPVVISSGSSLHASLDL
jgi:hypothetical protein